MMVLSLSPYPCNIAPQAIREVEDILLVGVIAEPRDSGFLSERMGLAWEVTPC